VRLADALQVFGLEPITGRAVRIAIVDSGVYAQHPHVHGIAGGISLVAGGDPADHIDRNGHGTAVAAAIREKVPGADLIVVKIFDRTLAATAGDLARAIGYAAGEQVDLINLSLGTTNPAHGDRLQAAVSAARSRGAVVVAAAAQAGLPSLPGSLRGVIAVTVDWECERDTVVVDAATAEVVRLRASGFPRPIPGVPPASNLKGVSFAVANATGLIARELSAFELPTPSHELPSRLS
jgi:subtilisin family serine protease